MCGIFGYIGKKNAVEIVLKGLKRLEYRGYDSSGIAGLNGTGLEFIKQAGKISEMESALEKKGLHLDMAIAHTRWATHGRPTEVNAHPHFNTESTLAIVHNGIIENHTELRNHLEKKGFSFVTDTDTEVIAHLISDHYKGDLLKAIGETLPMLKGAFSIAVIHKDHPNLIVGAANHAPLAVGVGEEEMFIASDVLAFGGQVNKVAYLNDCDIVAVRDGGYEFFDFSLVPITKELQEITFKPEEASRGDFQHYTLKEIFEQPQAVRSAMAGRILEEYGTAQFDTLSFDLSDLIGVSRIMIIACGTSYHAGFIGQYLLEEIAHIPTQVEISSEFRYKNPIVPEGTLAIAISQSGETADTLAALRELKAKGARVMAICNTYESSIAREADCTLYQRAGVEIGVCSTKAFTSQVTILTLFTLLMARMRHMSREEGQHLITHLLELPHQIEQVLKLNEQIHEIAKKYAKYENFFFLGRRYMFPTALEGALKLKEISYINANGYPAGEMKHGPIALISPDCPTVAFMGDKFTYEKMLSNLMEVKARSGPVIAIAEEGAKEISDIAEELITIPKTIDELAVIPMSVAAQLFAYYVALERGEDIDQPRNLAKSVTVE